MLDNVSNDLSINVFEASTGALNCAPVKISGQYKIVISADLRLWLDDYNNRRVLINMGTDFMPQVASFLRNPTILKDSNKLFYGGYSYPTTHTWHCPMYLGTDDSLPTYMVVARAQNANITNPATLQNFGQLITLIDLEQIGLLSLLRQMQKVALTDYPVQFNWNAAQAFLYGYSIENNSLSQQTITLLDAQANQPYYAVLNNFVLNAFKENGLIFPRLVNIECEFAYVDNKTHFNNFYGFLGYSTIIPLQDYSSTAITARVQHQLNSMSWIQQIDAVVTPKQYDVNVGSVTVIDVDAQPAQLRVLVTRIQAGDSFTVMHPDGTVYFEYILIAGDIKPTLLQTLKTLCIKMTTISGRFLVFSCTTNGIVTIMANIEDDLVEEYHMLPSGNFVFPDNNQKNFRQLTQYDLKLGNSASISIVEQYGKLVIDGTTYPIVDSFLFNGNSIVRFATIPVFSGYTSATIEETFTEDIIRFLPIPWLSANSDLKAYPQYDVSQYVLELEKKFVTDAVPNPDLDPAIEDAIGNFTDKNTAIDVPPYVQMDDTGNFQSKNTVAYDTTLNSNGVLFMGFNTPGSTSFLTPNMFNMDMQFWDKNGNPDPKLLKLDTLKYHWFLIKGECPAYLLNDARSMRYFTDTPKIGARLIANGTLWSGEAFCETVFLGVKYQFPQKYSNYLFSVYLDPNDESTAAGIAYNFEVDDANMLLRLRINKYLDFSDLIRGADSANPAFLDLGLLYSVTASYNSKSTVVSGFQNGGVLLADNTITTLFGDNITTDFKWQDIDNTWYICLKRSLDIVTSPFDEIFPAAGDYVFSIFQSITVDGVKYEYVSMDFTVKGIHQISPDYIWCRDLQVNFYDTDTILINKYGTQSDKIFHINKSQVLASHDAAGGIYGDTNIIATVMVDGQNQQFKLINYNKTFSFVDNWFELTRTITYPVDTSNPRQSVDGFFVFPTFIEPGWGLTELQTRFLEGSFDTQTKKQRITLFDRNQIWHMIRDVMVVEAKFKASTSAQIVNRLSDLLISQLQDTANLDAIPSTGSVDAYINFTVVDTDVNLVIWKTGAVGKETPKLHAVNRFHGPHTPYLRKLTDELKFQSDILTRPADRIQNIYDPNFIAPGVNATGFWKEVTGNIVSSLFCMAGTLQIPVPFGTQFDTRVLMSKVITLDEAIIVNNNAAYISKINANVNEYILSSYINWLLLNEYTLDTVYNELNQKLMFTTDVKNAYLVNFAPINTFQTRFNTLIFNFNKKQ